MKRAFLRFLMLAAPIIFLTADSARAVSTGGTQVQFTGVAQAVVVNGEGKGTLFISLDTADLRIIVNPATIIQDSEGAVLTIDALAQFVEEALETGSPAVEITGKVSASGILATKVRITEPVRDFNIRGQITAIHLLSETSASISLLGITLSADLGADTPTILQMNGMDVPLSALKPGTRIEAVGTILEDGAWAASTIKVLSGNKKQDLVIFQGTVQSYDEDAGILMLEVGDETPSIVAFLITPDTCIKGDIEVGADAIAIGTLNADLTFTAREIRVLAALDLTPGNSALDVGETAEFTITLLKPAGPAGVTVNLSAVEAGIVSLSETSLLIPDGAQTAHFTVTALAAGSATITAAALGDEATAKVKVTDTTGDDPDTPPPAVTVFFSPDHIKMKPNDTREVVLHVQPPQKTAVSIEFTSSNEEVVPIPTVRALSNGAAMFKVALKTLESAATETITITATLPAELGAGTATLEVVVEGKKVK